jgi:hypothetical protein
VQLLLFISIDIFLKRRNAKCGMKFHCLKNVNKELVGTLRNFDVPQVA